MAGDSKKTFREKMIDEAAASIRVAGSQRCERLAKEGLPSREELTRRIEGAFSVAERQFYEGLYDKYHS
jgi:hypothetical protein